MDLAAGLNIENAAPLAVGGVPAKSRKKHHKPHEDCQNCGVKLEGEFCHACGQHGHVHRSVLHVIEEVFHGITHFDSRTWRSMPMLAFRPGTLTRYYVMGKRARYVPPFAMFLFAIFAMFLAFAFSGGPGFVSKGEFDKATVVETAREKVADAQSDLTEATQELKTAQTDLAREQALREPDVADIDAAKREVTRTQARLTSATKAVTDAQTALAVAKAKPEAPAASAPATAPAAPTKSKIEGSASFNGQTDPQKALAEIQLEKAKAEKEGDAATVTALSIAETAAKAGVRANAKQTKTVGKTGEGEDIGFMESMKEALRNGDFTINTPWPSMNEKIKKKFQNPDLLIYKMQNTIYKFSFLLVPLSLPFLWVMLFWKRGVTLFDHAAFALYSLSFVSFLFLFISIAAHWFEVGPMIGAAAIILPIHIFFQFKGAYALKWFSALWRTCLFCGVFAWIVIGMFMMSIVVLGATG
jgi:Protein of unknown function (DUF3667)